MRKFLLTTITVLTTLCASAQFMVMTTLNKVEGMKATPPSTTEVYEGDVCPTTSTDDSYNITDKIGIGYQVNDKMLVGITKDGEDNYELLGRYTIKDGMWATCIYNYAPDSEAEMMDMIDLGIGYSMKVWKNLYIDPNYTMSMKEDENGEREGSFNLSFSYKF